jgi:tetratricopeptide (TPR) repeat protein
LRPESGDLRANLAEVVLRFGQLREAAFELQEAIRSGPSSDLARSAWFAGMAATGSVDQAHARYDEVQHKQTSEAHDNLGTVLLYLHDVDGAIREYRLATESDPRSAPANLNLGLTLADHAQPAEARQWLEAALRLNPELPAAHLKLGEVLLALDLHSDAMLHLKVAAACPDPRIRAAAEKLLESAK